jgi:hypothetical protein
MTKLVKGGDLIADATEVAAIVETPDSPEFSQAELEAAWTLLVAWLLAKQHTPGSLVVPCGKDTGLFNRITKKHLGFGVAFDVLEAGVKKPISDISIDNKIDGDSWDNVNERRNKRLANWEQGVFAARGGSKDELATQMKIEFEEDLKLLGLNKTKHADFFKGNVVKMLDFFEEAGNSFKGGRDAKLADLRTRAKRKLGDRGAAKAELVTTGLSI